MEIVLLFGLVVGFLMIGVPVAISLGLASVLFLYFFSDASLASIARTLFGAFDDHATLLAIPFFVLASSFMSTGGVARRIIRFAVACVGHLQGGLAIASVFACMMFAALSGSSPATVVAIGTIVIGAMRQVGYSKEFAAGVICNAGTLGILIPPSIVMVVYATATDTSVGRMFLAGVIPGLLAGLMLMVAIYIVARWKRMQALPFAGFSEIWDSARDAFWGLLLIVIIMIGIYGFPGPLVDLVNAVLGLISNREMPSGAIFTPTEAAAVSAVYAFFVANFVYRDMGPFKEDGMTAPGATFAYVAGFIVILGLAPLAADAAGVGLPSPAMLLVGAALLAFVPAMAAASAEGVGWEGSVGVARDLPRATLAFVHPDTKATLLDAGKLTIMLMFIIANALILKHVLTEERIPQEIAESLLAAGFGPVVFLVLVNVILLIGGQFMEPSGLLIIVAPLVFPIAIELGIDPIHLGIIMVVNMEIGMITPPVGLNLVVTSGVAKMPVLSVVWAALPFLGVLVVFLIMVTYIPVLSLWLPTMVMGPETIIR
ncbi:MAG: TRAP transporter large permease [Pseudomonadota bacterium]